MALRLFEEPLRAQQRDPAIEVYGLTGAYFFGNHPNLLKNGQWRAQVALGTLLPLGSKWAVLVDGNLSKLKVKEGVHSPESYTTTSAFYRRNPGIPDEDFTTQRLIAVLPSVVRLWRSVVRLWRSVVRLWRSVVRLWRRERFSIYLGGGLGVESQAQLIRHRLVTELTDPNGERAVDSMGNFTFGTLVRAEEFVDTKDVVMSGALILRGGVLVNLAPHVVLRMGYSLLPSYLDAPAPQSLEVGIGYRF